MKEHDIKNEEDKNNTPYVFTQMNGLQRKYSIDMEKRIVGVSSNLFSFSGVNDDQFLDSGSFSSIQGLSQVYNEGMVGSPSTSLNIYTSYSPSTPNSFGFAKNSYRISTVTIYHEHQTKKFPHVEVYMVNDQQDPSKAGLLFKSEQKDIDLKIDKKQGKELERVGKLENFRCQLWDEDFSQWVQVITEIHLQD